MISYKCWCIGSMLVSSCMCCMLVSCVHPVATLRAVVCIICSLSMLVSDALGDHMVEAYSCTGLVMALYVASMVSFCLPHFVEASFGCGQVYVSVVSEFGVLCEF